MILHLLLCILSVPLYAMSADSDQRGIIVYAIPGQNGLGSESWYVKSVVGESSRVIPVNTPSRLPDLGQYFCQRHLDDALIKSPYPNDDAIIYATSQGTATALNYLARKPSPNIKAVVLEAALASGNSAVYHTVTGPAMGIDWLRSIPGAYYILPYLASLFACIGYRPGGQQAIQSIDVLAKDLPIIIIHSRYDMQLPFDGACALYYRLRRNGNNNVYLMKKEGYNHVQILDGPYEKKRVNQILKKHLQPDGPSEQHDLNEYQPDPKQFEAQYDSLVSQERNHVYLECALVGAACLMAIKQLSGYL